jgi:hypothetical protein
MVNIGKVYPRKGHEGPNGGVEVRSTLSLTLAIDGVGGQLHAPAALPPGKTRYPLYRRLGGPQSRSGQVRKILPHRPARRESLCRLSCPGSCDQGIVSGVQQRQEN